MWKQRGFLENQNHMEKSTRKQRGFFDQRNYIQKVRGNEVEIRRNLVFEVSTIDVISTSNQRRFDVECSSGIKEISFMEEQFSFPV